MPKRFEDGRRAGDEVTMWGSTALRGEGTEQMAVRPPQPSVTRTATEARTETLRAAVSRLRRALAGYPVDLPDREIAEEQLVALGAMAASGTPEPARLRHSLLLVVSAMGSVSALAGPLAEVRSAVGLFGEPPVRRRS
jgi:Family of unknown function (DUF5955)